MFEVTKGVMYLQATRTTLIDNLNMGTTCYSLDIKVLTCGNVNITYKCMNKTVLYLNMFFIILNFQKDSLSYNWYNWN